MKLLAKRTFTMWRPLSIGGRYFSIECVGQTRLALVETQA